MKVLQKKVNMFFASSAHEDAMKWAKETTDLLAVIHADKAVNMVIESLSESEKSLGFSMDAGSVHAKVQADIRKECGPLILQKFEAIEGFGTREYSKLHNKILKGLIF